MHCQCPAPASSFCRSGLIWIDLCTHFAQVWASWWASVDIHCLHIQRLPTCLDLVTHARSCSLCLQAMKGLQVVEFGCWLEFEGNLCLLRDRHVRRNPVWEGSTLMMSAGDKAGLSIRLTEPGAPDSLWTGLNLGIQGSSLSRHPQHLALPGHHLQPDLAARRPACTMNHLFVSMQSNFSAVMMDTDFDSRDAVGALPP